MTRKDLSQVYYLTKELKMWERKLAELKEKSRLTSPELSDIPKSKTNNISDTTFEYVSLIMELQADIDAFKYSIEAKVKEIEDYIMTLDDSLLRQIIEYRCCQLKSWRDVAALIGSCTTEDSIKKYFNRKYPAE